LVVTFIEVKAKLVVASLRAKTGINAIFPLSKKKEVRGIDMCPTCWNNLGRAH
jgi:hypothetical protein